MVLTVEYDVLYYGLSGSCGHALLHYIIRDYAKVFLQLTLYYPFILCLL